MTLTIATKELKRAVNLLAPEHCKHEYIILGEDGAASVNGGVRMSVKLGDGFDDEESAVAMIKPLKEVMSKLKTDEVEVSFEANNVLLKAGRSRFRLVRYHRAKVGAVVPPGGDADVINMSLAAFEMLIDRVRYASAGGNETSRPTLRGVHIHSEDGQMVSVATDGHRLARYAVPVADSDVPVKITIGNDAVEAIKKFLNYEKKDQALQFIVGDGRAMLKTDFGSVTFTLLEGEFPDYKSIMPDMEHGLDIDTIAMRKALKRLKLVAPIDGRVDASLTDEELTLSTSSDSGSGEEGISYDGSLVVTVEPMCAFNGKFMLDALEPCECLVQFSATSPILLRGLVDNAYTAAVMPMRLTGEIS